MAKNLRSDGKRILVAYTLAVSSGNFVLQNGFHGVALTTQANGEVGWLNIAPGEAEVTISSGETWSLGALIYLVGSATVNALTSAASGNRLVGKVSRVYGTGDQNRGVPSGKVHLLVLPNNI